jgi:sulfopyruvate decarboxylase alpha subunit
MKKRRESKRASGAPSPNHWVNDIYDVLRSQKISVVSYVPDAGHASLIRLCQADKQMRSVVLTTEEEGVALAAGAYLGGKRAILLMQSSGVGNCINMLSLIKTCGFPFLALVTMRGEWGEFNPWQVPMGQGTPAALAAVGVIVRKADKADEVREMISSAAGLAFGSYCGVAVLLSQQLIGKKTFSR